MKNNTAKAGNTVSLHYRGTFDDGTEFDSSHSRGETMTVILGEGNLIPGFENAVIGMAAGDTKTISIEPKDAYGFRLEEAVQVVPKSAFPEDFSFKVGASVQGEREGKPVLARIADQDLHTVTMDFNHPMAGLNLNFEIELVDIQS